MDEKLTFHSITVEDAGTQKLADTLNGNFKKLEIFMNKREGTIKSRLDGFQRQLNGIEKQLENIASKDDLKEFVTKTDLNKKFDVLFKHFGIDPNLLT